MRVTWVQYAGLSLDMLREVKPEEEPLIEPELMMDISQDLYDRWETNYQESVDIANELEEIMRNK